MAMMRKLRLFIISAIIIIPAIIFGAWSLIYNNKNKLDATSDVNKLHQAPHAKIEDSGNSVNNSRPFGSIHDESGKSSFASSNRPKPEQNDLHPLRLTDNARRYVLEHINDSSGEARIFARRIVQECAMVRQFFGIHTMGNGPPTANPDIANIYNDTIDKFQRKCGQFDDVELDQLLKIEFESDSPIINLYNGKLRSDSTSRNQLIEELIASTNPVLIEDLALRVLVQSDNSGKFIYFRGEKYRLTDEKMGEALNELPCLLGLDCSPTSFRYGIACLNAGICTAMVRSPNELANQMFRDIIDGRISSFLESK